MRVAIIGAGHVGATLGRKWATAGHEVAFGVRHPLAEKARALVADVGHGVTTDGIRGSLENAEVVLFAIPGRVMDDTVAGLGRELNGKILIDATNNVPSSPMHSLDTLRDAGPESQIFRAFSNLGWENFAHPTIDGVQVDLFYCGDGGEKQRVVDELIADVGLRPIYIGGTDQAAAIDALTRLWFTLVQRQQGDRRLAFKLLQRRD